MNDSNQISQQDNKTERSGSAGGPNVVPESNQDGRPRNGAENPRQIWFEVGAAYLICVVLLFLSSLIASFGGFWAANAGTLPAAFCLLFPVHYAQRRGLLPSTFGLTTANLWKSLLVVLIAAAIVFPPYVVGFHLWVTNISGGSFKGFGAPFGGPGGPGASGASGGPVGLQSIWWLLNLIFVQVLAVALPEEVFYRGWIQTRLALVFRRRINVFGTPFGLHIVVASALFALSHLVLVPAPFRLAVFFPGLLFGLLREKTGSVVAPVILHAASNILLTLISQWY